MPAEWQLLLRQNFTRWERLADFLELNAIQRENILERSHFTLNLPLRLAQKIVKRTLDDPILRQFLPTKQETQLIEGFTLDPVGDNKCRVASKLLHKYKSRVLLVCTSACAMHCRYCFRQQFDYNVKDNTFIEELKLISADDSISEVILSGGDPLSLSDAILGKLLDNISAIPHIKRIRFHTRFPIGIPERINASFLGILQKVKCQIWFILHSNHSLELDEDVLSKMKLLQKQGVVLLNQSVLLKDVNDDVETLKELCLKLVDNGILPYYLHQLDRIQGAAHFEVPESKGIELMKMLSQQISGYALPRYVREIAGEPGKTILY
jgi:EF-P beta-lysylation protein EpmB